MPYSSPFAVLVNDDATQLNLWSGLLRKVDLEPRAFTRAEAALMALSSGADGPPALIVTDLYMPGIDGWQFCRLLRSPDYKAFNQVPILVVSATFSGDQSSRIAADLGAEAFLPSPVDGERFCEQVQAILSGEQVRHPLRVLIVDDSVEFCEVLKETFAKHGYQAETVFTAKAASEAFRKTAYDVAVLDYHLTDGLGDALLVEFRALQPDCVCLMVTGDTGPELALNWMKKGAAAYLQKPFQPDYIIELCARARRERALLRVQDLLELRTRELRQSEAFGRTVIDSLSAHIAVLDESGVIVAVNEAWRRFARENGGHSKGVRVGANYFTACQSAINSPENEFSTAALQGICAVMNGSQPFFSLEYPCHSATEQLWFCMNVLPLEEKRAWVVVAHENITERRKNEDAKAKLEIQNRQLQKAESLGRMAGAIAHHFNNQLQAIMMNLQLAMQPVPGNAELIENLIEANKSARKAAEVSTLMLTYLGQTAATYEPLDLCETCQRHLPMLRTVIPQSVTLKTELDSHGPVVNANANQIQQILTNLLTNAWESMSEIRGVVRLTVKTVPAVDIPRRHCFPIDCELQEKAYACAEVADEGCGIASKDIEKVFDPFFSTKFAGRGLGLSVVLGIVRAHGGCVTVERQPEHGSVFRVFLPLTAKAIPQKPIQVAHDPKAAGGTVLVVDDEPCLRKAVTIVLKRSGFTVYEAQDGVEALEVFQQHRDDIGCVLCDLTMPRMDGWETLTELRKLAPDIPVILSSGHSEAQAMAGEHPELPQAFLSKPYELPTLRDAIVRFMK